MTAHNALSIAERVRFYKDQGFAAYDFDGYQRWVNRPGLLTESGVQVMLDTCQMSREDMNLGLKSLTESEVDEIKPQVEQTRWRILFHQIMDTYLAYDRENFLQAIDSSGSQVDVSLSLAPFTAWAADRISATERRLEQVRLSEQARIKILDSLSQALLSLSIKTIVWELHCYKSANLDMTKESSEDRVYRSFVLAQFATPDNLQSFYEKYPVIARRVTTKCDQVTNHFMELLERLDADYVDICTNLMPQPCKPLVTDLTCSTGDVHQQGRSVVLVHFDNGRVAYKPRNLAVGLHFGELVAYLNGVSSLIDLRACRGLYRDSYSFEEYVQPHPCSSMQEVENYYRRFGQLCALVYACGGTDMHFENIIACGEYPVIVDIETIMQHQLTELFDTPTNAFNNAFVACMDSVSGTSMLPMRAFGQRGDRPGVDISALGGDEQQWPHKVLGLVHPNTDDMRFEYQDVMTRGGQNLPSLDDQPVTFDGYQEIIIEAFEEYLNELALRKEAILAPGGALEAFKKAKVRVILKATMNYTRFADFASHPKYSTDMLDLERMLANQWAYAYKDKRPVVHEVADLLEGDIPIFFCNADSHDLITSEGTVIESYFGESPYEKAHRRISGLNETTISAQKAHVLVSLGVYQKSCQRQIQNNARSLNFDEPPKVIETKTSTDADLLRAARLIGDTILDLGVVDAATETVMWNDVLHDRSQGHWKISPVDLGLERGLGGILLFLTALAQTTNTPQYEVAVKRLLNMVEAYPTQPNGAMGLADGEAGIVFALAQVGGLFDQDKGTAQKAVTVATSRARELTRQALGESALDISLYYGLTGIAIALTEVYDKTRDEVFLDFAQQCLEKLGDQTFAPEMTPREFGFGHGLLGQHHALNEFLNRRDHPSLELLNQEIHQQLKSNCEAFLKTCSFGIEDGLCGLLLAQPSLLPSGSEPVRLLSDIVTRDVVSDSLMGGLSGLSLVCAQSSGATLPRMSTLLGEMLIRREEHGRYAIGAVAAFDNVGLFEGLSGVGLALLSGLTDSNVWKRKP